MFVVSTNVAETSLTIPNIKYVVDSGKEKKKVKNLFRKNIINHLLNSFTMTVYQSHIIQSIGYLKHQLIKDLEEQVELVLVFVTDYILLLFMGIYSRNSAILKF